MNEMYAARTASNGILSKSVSRVPIDLTDQKIADVMAIPRALAKDNVVLFDAMPQVCGGGVCDFVSGSGRVMVSENMMLLSGYATLSKWGLRCAA